MTARRILLPFAALALVAAAFVLPFGSSSNSNADAVTAPAEPLTAFTIMDDGQGLCDLYTIDLATGALTDLPAPSSEAACADDLAVASNGTVYGIAGTQFFAVGSVSPSYDSLGGAELITFSANGTPSGQSLTIGGAPSSGISGGSIAVDAAGTVYVIAINETTCDPRLAAPGSFDPSDTYAFSCLFTVNLSNGELTQVGEGFSPNTAVYGLTSCASNMWSLMPGLPPTVLVTLQQRSDCLGFLLIRQLRSAPNLVSVLNCSATTASPPATPSMQCRQVVSAQLEMTFHHRYPQFPTSALSIRQPGSLPKPSL